MNAEDFEIITALIIITEVSLLWSIKKRDSGKNNQPSVYDKY